MSTRCIRACWRPRRTRDCFAVRGGIADPDRRVYSECPGARLQRTAHWFRQSSGQAFERPGRNHPWDPSRKLADSFGDACLGPLNSCAQAGKTCWLHREHQTRLRHARIELPERRGEAAYRRGPASAFLWTDGTHSPVLWRAVIFVILFTKGPESLSLDTETLPRPRHGIQRDARDMRRFPGLIHRLRDGKGH